MKMQEAMDIINGANNRGFMVTFEEPKGGLLYSGHFPDKREGEDLIPTEDEAWELATKFARASFGKYVNIYVIDSNFVPVPSYDKKKIYNR